MSRGSFVVSRVRSTSPRAKGVAVLVLLVLFTLLSFNRSRVETTLSAGDHLKVELTRNYKLVPYQSVVKLAGVEVGMVTGVKADKPGVVVDLKLDKGVREKLGTEPSANVRPTLLLGGKYYVELVRGGKTGEPGDGSTIPVARTSVPVELDRVLSAVTPEASDAIGGTLSSLEATFDKRGQRAVRRLLDDAPATLAGTTEVLTGLRGTRRGDLTRVVSGLQNAAAALNRDGQQWERTIDDLADTSAAFADEAPALASAIQGGAETLTVTRAGLKDLQGSLTRLRATASSLRPSARELGPLLTELRPVLSTARPVLADARVVARDARPVVENLVPTAVDSTEVLDNLAGPVLDRLDGPIKQLVLRPWHGTGVYDGGGNDHRFYEETGYLFSDMADVFKFHDHNGAMGRLMAGFGLSTPGGLIDFSGKQLLEKSGMQQSAGPQEGANDGEPAPPLGAVPAIRDPDLLLPLLSSRKNQ